MHAVPNFQDNYHQRITNRTSIFQAMKPCLYVKILFLYPVLVLVRFISNSNGFPVCTVFKPLIFSSHG